MYINFFFTNISLFILHIFLKEGSSKKRFLMIKAVLDEKIFFFLRDRWKKLIVMKSPSIIGMKSPSIINVLRVFSLTIKNGIYINTAKESQ